MAKPDGDYVMAHLAAFDAMRLAGGLIAYPAKLVGMEVIVLGRLVDKGEPDVFDSAPYFIVVNDEISAALDITEAQT